MTTVTEVASKGLNLLTVGGITAIIIVLLFIVGAIVESIYVKRQSKNKTFDQELATLKKGDLIVLKTGESCKVVTNMQHVDSALVRPDYSPNLIIKVKYEYINDVLKN